MTRWTSSANQTAAEAQSVVLVTMVDLDIPGDRLRVHDGAGTISWGGNDWLGVGQYGSIDTIAESFDVIATPVKITLSGVDASLVNDAMTTQYHGRDISIYIGIVDKETGRFADDPEVMWEGQMDVMTIEIDQGSAKISLTCEHRLRRIPSTNRYTDEDQRMRYSGDVFFEHLYKIPNFRGRWGSRDVVGGTSGGGGMGGGGGRQVEK